MKFDEWKEIMAERMSDGAQRFQHVEYDMGWHVREDGDIEAADGIFPLDEFAAAGRIDSVALKMAREIKAKWLAAPVKHD